MRNLCIVVLMALLLAGCSWKGVFGWPKDHWKNQDFKPYIENQQAAQPASASALPWLYTPGIDPAAVAQQLAASDIITSVKREKSLFSKNQRMLVGVGPHFYKLSPADQRQVMVLTDEMYRLSQQADLPVYLKDGVTQKIIGQYADKNLMVY